MAQPEHNLIVNYLPQQMRDGELYSMFITIGPIESCHIVKDRKTGYSFGFGFVCYKNPEDAAKAIEKLNGQQIYSKRIKVSYVRPSMNLKDTNLYVTNLPRFYGETDLENLFKPYGQIIQKNLLKDKHTKMSRGVAFVRFNKTDEAKSAIENLNGKIPEGGNEALGVRVADDHGKQRLAYYAGRQAALKEMGHAALRGGRPLRGGTPGVSRGGGGTARGTRGGRGRPVLDVIRGGGGPINRGGMHGSMVAYPLKATYGWAPMRREQTQVRYNPLGFQTEAPSNTNYWFL